MAHGDDVDALTRIGHAALRVVLRTRLHRDALADLHAGRVGSGVVADAWDAVQAATVALDEAVDAYLQQRAGPRTLLDVFGAEVDDGRRPWLDGE